MPALAVKTFFDFDTHEPINSDLIHQLRRPRLPTVILLATGGWSGNNLTGVIEAYDSRADRWVRVTPENELPRANHGTAVLNELVYCVGGFDGVEFVNTVGKYGLITKTWHEMSNVVGQHVTSIPLPLQKGLWYSYCIRFSFDTHYSTE